MDEQYDEQAILKSQSDRAQEIKDRISKMLTTEYPESGSSALRPWASAGTVVTFSS